MQTLFDFNSVNAHANKTIGQLSGAALPLALAERLALGDTFSLVIVPDNLHAQRLFEEVRYLQPTLNIAYFPDWETLPYDLFSPHQDIISERLRVLAMLLQAEKGMLMVSATTLLHPLPPQSFLRQHSLQIKKGDKLSKESFKQHLLDAGYRFVTKVLEHGECALRGAIIDLYPMGSRLPFRIELFDDEIETIRSFNPEDQLTIERIDHINLLPAREFPIDKAGITHFRQAFRKTFSGNPSQSSVYEEVSQGIMPAGVEYYLPLFFDSVASLFDYLPKRCELLFIDDCIAQAEAFYQEIIKRFEQRAHDILRPILPPAKLFSLPDSLGQQKAALRSLHLVQDTCKHGNANIIEGSKLPINRHDANPLKAVTHYIDKHSSKRILIMAESIGRREVLIDLFKEQSIHLKPLAHWQDFLTSDVRLAITEGPFASGFEFIEKDMVLICEAQLFGEHVVNQRKRKRVDGNTIVKDLTELKINAPVVHIEHGVGRYRGLKRLEAMGQVNEFLVLEYAHGDKIYVPVTSLHLISRYTGGGLEHAPLHKLGNDRWEKERKKAEENVSDIAAQLLDVYATREAKVGFAHVLPKEQYKTFVGQFPFEETDDQQTAIAQVLKDLQSKKPMERLVCGDVGFGKTEVAMRAAFVAVQNNKQVCVLVPTTLLADQHYENFKDRFAEHPVNIDILSRFRSKKEQDNTLKALASGRADIVIGTHKLFQKDIQFKHLGLLVIDEEHRFGVKQKEHIKTRYPDLDILSLTATPIPRTLNMAMSGLRDISIIATPPAKRLAIKTFAQEKNKATIQEAILREVLRGGQVFYLHNNVDTIERTVEELAEWLPDVKFAIAHGQMRERQLESVMADFYHHKFNVLVCTTIIETGIDIPTANTIIIDRADKFGLAQLHQLRGRVGRSHHQAYAYLMTPHPKALTSDATKRLEAFLSIKDLGAGFMLATHDLEIRGAGELLGDNQSGNMHAIGFSLYMELLDRAVKALRSGKQPELSKPFDQGPMIQLNLSTIIPEDYMGDVHTRLVFYKRIANCETAESLTELGSEMVDRFGLLPQSVKDLFRVTELKLTAKALGIAEIHAQGASGKMVFTADTAVDPKTVIHLIQVHAKRFKLAGPTALAFTIDDSKNRIDEVYKTLSYFSCE